MWWVCARVATTMMMMMEVWEDWRKEEDEEEKHPHTTEGGRTWKGDTEEAGRRV